MSVIFITAPKSRSVYSLLVLDPISIFQNRIINIPHQFHVYLSSQTKDGCTSKGKCDYQGCVVARIALTTGCCCCLSKHRMRQQLIDDSIIKYRDLLENVISCSPGINRWYRVIGIFLTISPVRHSNRRYSSIMKSKDLLHKISWYLSLRICTSGASQLDKKKEKNRQKKEKWYYIPIQDHPVSSRTKQALIALICCGQCIWLLVCREMAIWPLFSCPEWPYRDALGTSCIDSSRGGAFGTNCGQMAIFAPRE